MRNHWHYVPPSRTSPHDDAFVLLLLMVVVAGLSFLAGRMYEQHKSLRRSDARGDVSLPSGAPSAGRAVSKLRSQAGSWRGEGTTPAPGLPEFGGVSIQHVRASGGDGVRRVAQEGATWGLRQKRSILLAASPSGEPAGPWGSGR